MPLAHPKPVKRRTAKKKARTAHRRRVAAVRQAVFERDLWCRACEVLHHPYGSSGIAALLNVQPPTEMHHIVFRSHGGTTSMANCLGLCQTHHDALHARTLYISGTDANGPLRFTTEKPR